MNMLRKVSPLLVVVAVLLLAPLARAQVLQQVPSDALVVIKFNKLKPTSDKLAALATKLGLAEFKPEFADPLGSMKKEMKITQGLDDAGDAAVVLTNTLDAHKEPELIMLLPVTDYQAFARNFPDGKTDGGITTFTWSFVSGQSFMTQRGNYAAIASAKEVLAAKPDGLTAQGLGAKELDSKDIVAYANMKVARTRILPEIAKGRAKFLAEFEKGFQRGMNPTPPPRRPGAPRGAAAAAPATQPAGNAQAQKFLPVLRAMMNRGIDVAEQLVRDSDAAAYGLAIGADGIGTTALVEFSPQSSSAQRVAQFKQTDDSMLKGLPATQYMFYGGMVSDSKAGVQLISDLVAPVEKELGGLGADGLAINNYIASLKKLWGAMNGQSFGWVVPKGALGQEALFQMVSVNRGDAKTIVAAQQEMFNTQQAFMDMFMPPQAKSQMKINFVHNAKTVDGVALNQFTTQFTPPAGRQSPQQMQMQQMMMWMYGPNGMNGYLGAVGDDKVIAAIGTPDPLLTQLIAAAKADQDNLSNTTGLKAVTAQLPQKRMMAMYFAADQLASTVANYAKMFGMPVNFQMPQNLPPIGFTIGTDGPALRADSYVPAQLVQSIVAAVQQTMMQMKGGVRPGGPGGL